METCQAIILKHAAYTDTQKIIRVYSRDKGYLSFITPSLIFKRKHNPVHLLQLSEIEYSENEKGGLQKLRSISPLTNLPDLYSDIFKMNIVLLWAEMLDLILHQETGNENLFDFITRSTEYLNATQEDTANFNLFFLYRLAGLIGFRIDTDSWREGSVFQLQDGTFQALPCPTPYITGPNTASVIYRLCTCPLEELKTIPLDRPSRNVLLDVVLTFYRLHLHINFNIKSIQVIREVFS